MPNIGTILREEISRLSRKETRSQGDPAKKVGAQHRKDIAVLKRQVAQLEKQVALLARKVLGTTPAKAAGGMAAGAAATTSRFSAKGLRTHRNRLGLSAGDFGKLMGVSAQSIYNWEREGARPRSEQIAKLGVLKGIGKREAAARLEQVGGTKAAKEVPA